MSTELTRRTDGLNRCLLKGINKARRTEEKSTIETGKVVADAQNAPPHFCCAHIPFSIVDFSRFCFLSKFSVGCAMAGAFVYLPVSCTDKLEFCFCNPALNSCQWDFYCFRSVPANLLIVTS